MPTRWSFAAVLAAGTLVSQMLGPRGASTAEDRQPLEARIRRPASLVFLDPWLFVANERSGSLSVIDVSLREVVAETDWGKSLVDVQAFHQGARLAAVDRDGGQIVILDRDGARLTERQRLAVPPSPVTLRFAPDENRATMACLWPKKLLVFELGRNPARGAEQPWSMLHTVELPFAPREQLFLDDSRLLVADAFAGHLAVVDVARGQLVAVHDTSGQNVRGLTLSPEGDRVWLTLQRLSAYGSTTHEDVFWGGVIQNILLDLPVAAVVDPQADLARVEAAHYLGRPREGAGDPDALLTTAAGITVVALAGIQQVAMRRSPAAPFEQRRVARRPVALQLDPKRRQIFVACQQDDAVCVLDVASWEVSATLPLGPPVPDTPADQGESLFYDATLSLDGWYSCHSCHTDGHTTGLLNDNFGDNSTGAPKRIPSLLGTADTGPWAWNGQHAGLEEQLGKSLLRTMQGAAAPDDVVAALAAYVRRLPAPPRGADLFALDAAAVARGQLVFRDRNCAECHAPPTYTSPATYDVGLQDQVGNKDFNPPDLRAVGLRSAYFHDNRARTLRDVFESFQHPDGAGIADAELDDLLAFLRSL